ncbi:gamma carbonic anhydrase family protein [Chloroflexota bacterium]
MIREFDGKTPKIAPSAFVSEWAYVVGDVEVGEGTGVWPGAVIRGDFGRIVIGRNCQVEDNAVLHTGNSLTIGDDVIIGHSAVVHCLNIGQGVLIGNNATILDDAEVGDNCIIGANSMVSMGKKVPHNSFAAGVPAEVKWGFSKQDIESMYRRMSDKYPHIGADSYPEMARRFREQGL